MKFLFWICCLTSCVTSCLLSGSALAKDQIFAKKSIHVGGLEMKVEVAETPAQHEQGLMFRKSLADDTGMIFIFRDSQIRYFWMKNTFIPLSIGYFDDKGVLVDIQDMAPVKSEMEQNPPSYPSRAAAKYALEVNQGWFQRQHIPIGSKLSIP